MNRRLRTLSRQFRDRWRMVPMFIAIERALLRSLPCPLRPGLVLRGFHSFSQSLYRFDVHPRELYVSDLQRLRSDGIDGEAGVLLNDKMLFERVFGRWLPVPPNLAITRRTGGGGVEIRSLSDVAGTHRPLTVGECLDISPEGVVCKPLQGSQGKSIVFVHRDGAHGCSWNGTAMSLEEAEQRLQRRADVLVVHFVRQAEATAAYNPRTTNTLRVLTMVDPRTGKAFVARAVQRIGVRASEPVDNWSKGGLSARVDARTGRLGPGVTKPSSGPLEWHAQHPETHAPIEGTEVPNWTRIREGLLQTAERFPMLPYIGWDVIPTDTGYSVIEGNFRSDVNLLQVHGGLLADEQVRDFYAHHGLISAKATLAAANAAGRSAVRP
jgi:hypothetical protein